MISSKDFLYRTELYMPSSERVIWIVQKTSVGQQASIAGKFMDPALQTEAEQKLAALLVDSLQLEVSAADIAPLAPLFGDGLGLDSIDALELALAISQAYGIELRSDDERKRRIFASLRALSDYIDAAKPAVASS